MVDLNQNISLHLPTKNAPVYLRLMLLIACAITLLGSIFFSWVNFTKISQPANLTTASQLLNQQQAEAALTLLEEKTIKELIVP